MAGLQNLRTLYPLARALGLAFAMQLVRLLEGKLPGRQEGAICGFMAVIDGV